MANIPVEIVLDVVGEVSQEVFKGVFKVRPRQSFRDVLQEDQYRRELLGAQGGQASPVAQAYAASLAKIWTQVTESPGWWRDSDRGLQLQDENVIFDLYTKIVKLEEEHRRRPSENTSR